MNRLLLLSCVFAGLLSSTPGSMATPLTATSLTEAQAFLPSYRLTVAIETDPIGQEANSGLAAVKNQASLAAALGVPVHVVSYKSLREVARAGNAGELDAAWVPSNIASSLMAKGYKLLGSDGKVTQMALLARATITDPLQLIGRGLYLPQEDSLAGYVGIAMLSERGVRLSDFDRVLTVGNYDIAVSALANGIVHVTALPDEDAVAWITAHPGEGSILGRSPEVPRQMLVVRETMDESTKLRLHKWMSKNFGLDGQLAMPSAETLKYISRIAHYTPDVLTGVQRVTAKQAVELLAQDVKVVDVRTPNEFTRKRIRGAQLVPYTELSGRIPGGNYSNDPFPLAEITAKKVLFYCNGPECWKSYKAATRALQSRRFDVVYWLRGGVPEWENAGLPIAEN